MASILAINGRWRATVRLASDTKSHNKTFDRKADAKAWADDLEYKLRHQEVASPNNVRVKKLIEEYENLRLIAGREVCKLRSNNTYFMLKHLKADFGEQIASKITTQDYIKWVTTGVTEGRGRNALSQELNLLKTCFKRGSAVLGINLPDHLDKAILLLTQMDLIKPTSNKRTRKATGTELNQIMQHLPDWEMRIMVRVAAILGFRRGELLNLRWADFDAENKMLLVRDRKHPRAKQGNNDNVPLLFGSFELINELPRTHEKIFPTYSAENVSDWFLKACRACNPPIEDLHFHDLRHTAITSLFENGLQIQQVALISGHRDWKHLKRYTNLEPVDLHDDFPNGNLT